MVLTAEQKKELSIIVNNVGAFGAYSGMVSNLSLKTNTEIEAIVKHSLNVRIKIKELMKDGIN